MAAGRDHVHHRLLNLGCSVSETTILLHASSLLLSALALICVYAPLEEWLLFAMITGLLALNLYAGTHFLSLISNNSIIRSAAFKQRSADLVAVKGEVAPASTQGGKRAA